MKQLSEYKKRIAQTFNLLAMGCLVYLADVHWDDPLPFIAVLFIGAVLFVAMWFRQRYG